MGKKSELEKVEPVSEPTPEPTPEPVSEPAPVVEPVLTKKVKKPRTAKQLAADEKLRQRAKDLREFKKAKEAEKLAVTTHPHVSLEVEKQAPPPPPPPPKPKKLAKPKPAPKPEPEQKPTDWKEYEHKIEYVGPDDSSDDEPPKPPAKHFRLPKKYRMKS